MIALELYRGELPRIEVALVGVPVDLAESLFPQLLDHTAIFYLLIGAGVSLATYLRPDDSTTGSRIARLFAACVFWPLFVPFLLTPSSDTNASPGVVPKTQSPTDSTSVDELASAITQVETELDAALKSLDGWAENVLSLEQDRLHELRSAWRLQADRIRELDRLLAQPLRDSDLLSKTAADSERVRHSEKVRRDNLQRLQSLRQQMHADCAGTLAWVGEVATMIHVAKFTGAPASRAEELVAQLAAAVEGLSEASSWSVEQQLVS